MRLCFLCLVLLADRIILTGAFREAVKEAPRADLNILGLQEEPDFDFMVTMVSESASSCLFVADSGRESSRA